MVVADTSAWIEYLRATGSPEHLAMRAHLDAERVVVTDPVLMEVLAGARSDREVVHLRGLLGGCHYVGVLGPSDYEDAAALKRRCRDRGRPVRRAVDCLIAAVAIRADLEVLHRDRDFTVIAAHCALRVAAP